MMGAAIAGAFFQALRPKIRRPGQASPPGAAPPIKQTLNDQPAAPLNFGRKAACLLALRLETEAGPRRRRKAGKGLKPALLLAFAPFDPS